MKNLTNITDLEVSVSILSYLRFYRESSTFFIASYSQI